MNQPVCPKHPNHEALWCARSSGAGGRAPRVVVSRGSRAQAASPSVGGQRGPPLETPGQGASCRRLILRGRPGTLPLASCQSRSEATLPCSEGPAELFTLPEKHTCNRDPFPAPVPAVPRRLPTDSRDPDRPSRGECTPARFQPPAGDSTPRGESLPRVHQPKSGCVAGKGLLPLRLWATRGLVAFSPLPKDLLTLNLCCRQGCRPRAPGGRGVRPPSRQSSLFNKFFPA